MKLLKGQEMQKLKLNNKKKQELCKIIMVKIIALIRKCYLAGQNQKNRMTYLQMKYLLLNTKMILLLKKCYRLLQIKTKKIQ